MLKKRIRKISVCTLVLAFSVLFCGCENSVNEKSPETSNADLPETNVFEAPNIEDIKLKIDVDADKILSKQKIIFIMRSTSFAEGFMDIGYFVDNEGYRHFFDSTRYSLSKHNDASGSYISERADEADVYEYLLEHFDEYEKEEFLSSEDLKTYVRLLYNVDETAEVAVDDEMTIFDYPSHEIYGVKMDEGNLNFVWLVDRGANFTWLDDDCAKKIVDSFGSDWMKTGAAISEEDSLKQTEEWQEKRNMKKTEIGGDDGTIIVYVPDGWECVGFPQTETNGSYSIRIKPDASYDGYISISFEYQFGVCGTGLDEKEIRLAGDKAVAGYYDGKDKWSFIAYKGKNENIVALNYANEWFEEYEDEIMKILDYIDFDPNYFPDHEHKSFKQDNGIGISLVAKNVSATGAELYFICNSDDNEHEYFYGDYYSLSVYNKENNCFESMFEGDMVFDDIAYMIKQGVPSEFSINWEPVFGKLEPGLYRLEKIVNDINYDSKKDAIYDYTFPVDFVIY